MSATAGQLQEFSGNRFAEMSHFFQDFGRVRAWLGTHSLAQQPADLDKMVCGISVDSRSVQPGGLFFALAGRGLKSRDGHRYLQAAVDNGARFLCIDRRFAGLLPTKAAIARVDHPLKSLQELARQYLAWQGARVIAVTGSVGKSTATQLLRQLLQSHIPTGATLGNQNGQIGVPLSLLNNLQAAHRWMVLEMGIDGPDQMANLVRIAPPEIALITALSRVHMARFCNLRALGLAKAGIFFSPATRVGLLNARDSLSEELARQGQCPKLFFGRRQLPNLSLWGQLRGQTLHLGEASRRLKLPYPEALAPHQLDSLLAALCAARQVPLNFEEIAKSLSRVRGLAGRFLRICRDALTLVDDTYNASAASVLGALKSLPAPKSGGRRWAVLAKMEDLGSATQREHQRVAAHSARALDALICLEPMPEVVFAKWQCESKPIWRASSHEQILEILRGELRAGDVVLLKGSRKGGLDRLVKPLLDLAEQLANRYSAP